MFDVKLMRRLDSQVGNLACSLLAVATSRPTRQ